VCYFLAFDWVEDSQTHFDASISPQLALESLTSEDTEPHKLAEMKRSPTTTSNAVLGGCHLSDQQYQDLILFRKFDHVTKW